MTLSEEQSIEVHDHKVVIDQMVHDLVDRMTEDLTPEQDQILRQQLTDEFRFWRHQ